MATTYGYAGEFSSDDEHIVDQQAYQRSNQDPFNQPKPSKEEIEQIIETIRSVSPDKNVDFPDDTLATLLDHFKIQRGPIVDSTRGLYKKIVLRAIRGNLHEAAASNGEQNNNVNNYDGVAKKQQQQQQQAEVAASSDEDEPMPPASSQSSVDMVNKAEPMEVDAESTLSNQIREKNQIDIATTSDSEADDDETEESDDEPTTIDIGSSKKTNDLTVLEAGTAQPIASTPITKRPLVKRTPKNKAKSSSKADETSSSESKKRHYTRSQRLASTSQQSKVSSSDASSVNPLTSATDKDGSASVASSSKVVNSCRQTSKFNARFLIPAFLMIFLALLSYYFRSELVKSKDRVMSIKFN